MSVEDELGAALRAAAGAVTPPVSRLVDGGIARGRRRRRQRRAAAAAGGGAVVLVFAAAVVGLTRPDSTAGREVAAAGPSCASVVRRGVLPVWARAGFSAAQPRIPHVLGERGEIAAVLFADPLTAGRTAGPTNKVLWRPRAREGAGARLTIRATQPGRAGVLQRLPAGPGPSVVDVPHPGCWRVELTWGTRRDTVFLHYQPAPE